MESFSKNFNPNGLVGNVQSNLSTKYCIKRRSAEEILCALGLLSFVLGFCVQYWSDSPALLIFLVALLSAGVALAYMQSNDYILLGPSNTLVLVRGFLLSRSRLEIPIQDIQFVGIGIGSGEKFATVGNHHQVYIQHKQLITPIRCFRVGREAVVLAKSLKKFIEG